MRDWEILRHRLRGTALLVILRGQTNLIYSCLISSTQRRLINTNLINVGSSFVPEFKDVSFDWSDDEKDLWDHWNEHKHYKEWIEWTIFNLKWTWCLQSPDVFLKRVLLESFEISKINLLEKESQRDQNKRKWHCKHSEPNLSTRLIYYE